MAAVGIIPACAGSRLPVAELLERARDHPRVCGEQFISELRVGEGSTGDIEEIANTMVNRGLVDRVRVVSI